MEPNNVSQCIRDVFGFGGKKSWENQQKFLGRTGVGALRGQLGLFYMGGKRGLGVSGEKSNLLRPGENCFYDIPLREPILFLTPIGPRGYQMS